MLTTLLLFCAIGSVLTVPLQDDVTPRQGESCGYESCTQAEQGMLNVHIVPHTHDDVGWVKTVDQYFYGNELYKDGVQYILESVIDELWQDEKRRFIYVETAFFWKWWVIQPDIVRDTVHALVRQGRLQFAGGAWSMNDEAAAHYQSIIDQFTWGLQKLNQTFGACGIPRVGWQIDPFGHSREFASLLSAMGYDGLFLGRIDYQDKLERLSKKTMEMLWRGDDDLGKSSDIFTSVLYNQYEPPPGFCFDVHCYYDPIVDEMGSPVGNVDKRIQFLLEYALNQSRNYRTDNIILTMGGDFTYQDAGMWYRNLDKLIEITNLRAAREGRNIKLFYSTPTCYLKAIKDANPTLPTKQDDFFPYASDPTAYWTGYFTSRPTTKYFEREGNNYLQMVKQLQVLSGLEKQNLLVLNELKSAMGVMQHHDAITGTEQQHVTHDYERMLNQAIEDALLIARQAFNKLMQGDALKPPLFTYDRCRLNESSCVTSENSDQFVVTVYNHLAWNVNESVRVPVLDGGYEVYAPDGEKITSQLLDITAEVQNIPTRLSKATHEVIFIARLHPVSYKSFYIKKQLKNENPTKIEVEFFGDSSEHWKTTIDKTNVNNIGSDDTVLFIKPKIPDNETKKASTETLKEDFDFNVDDLEEEEKIGRGMRTLSDKSRIIERPDNIEDGFKVQERKEDERRRKLPIKNENPTKIEVEFFEDLSEHWKIIKDKTNFDNIGSDDTLLFIKPKIPDNETKKASTETPKEGFDFNVNDLEEEEKIGGEMRTLSDKSRIIERPDNIEDGFKVQERKEGERRRKLPIKNENPTKIEVELLEDSSEHWKPIKDKTNVDNIGSDDTVLFIKPKIPDNETKKASTETPKEDFDFNVDDLEEEKKIIREDIMEERLQYPVINEEEMRTLSDKSRITERPDNVKDGFRNIKVRLNKRTKEVMHVSLRDGRIMKNMHLKYAYYPGCSGDNRHERSSGAYVFRPNSTNPIPLKYNFVTEKKGPVVFETRAKIDGNVAAVIRLYEGMNFIESEWLVGPIDIEDDVGKEYIVSYKTTNIWNNGVFYTDSNGRQVLKRKLNKRPQWNVTLEEPIAGNYYPVTNEIYIKDYNHKFVVLTDRSQGGTSVGEGKIELMLHRRLLDDDGFGVDEALNEIAEGKGLVVRGKHRILLTKSNDKNSLIEEKKMILQLHLQPQVFISDAKDLSLKDWLKLKNSYSFTKSLPDGIHLLTLEPWGESQMLLRLENYIENDDTNIEVDLNNVFKKLVIKSFKEAKLAANQWMDNSKWIWNTEGEFSSNFNKQYGSFVDIENAKDVSKEGDDGFKIKLKSKQIRTFVVDYELKL